MRPQTRRSTVAVSNPHSGHARSRTQVQSLSSGGGAGGASVTRTASRTPPSGGRRIRANDGPSSTAEPGGPMGTIASTADVIRTHARERGDEVAIVQRRRRLPPDVGRARRAVEPRRQRAGCRRRRVGGPGRVPRQERLRVLRGPLRRRQAQRGHGQHQLAAGPARGGMDRRQRRGEGVLLRRRVRRRRSTRSAATCPTPRPSSAWGPTTGSRPTSRGSATTRPTRASSPVATTSRSSSTRRAPRACPRA